MELMTREVSDAILELANQVKKASIFRGSTQKPFEVQSVTIDLSTAKLSTDPYRIGFSFKSVYISAATDVLANISMLPNSRDSFQSAVPLKLNDSWSIENPVAEAYLYWPAQAGKTMTLHFFVESEFRSGSQISVTGGGVSIVSGSSFTRVVSTLVAATATAILTSDTTRKQANIQNNTGGYLYFGESTITDSGTTKGIELAPGGTFQWTNTAALYAYSAAGGDITTLSEY